ncbi:UvrD-helicase domain-containing protein [Demequina sp. NBRC 110057]|uniref:UvrD-helicase domain-containing protein n=1 Tax=Demequina sp. NBRC 110057 TaxID=1570346 RepID=UPI0013564F8F|nr:UvrD-helicase domain-containing protein [Demequina sp. NBRC 110057]
MAGRVTRTGWSVEQQPGRLLVHAAGRTLTLEGDEAQRLRVSRWFLRRSLVVDGPVPWRLVGVRRADAVVIRRAVSRASARGLLVPHLDAASLARDRLDRLIATREREQRWIAYDDVVACLRGMPTHAEALAELDERQLAELGASLDEAQRGLLEFLSTDHLARVSAANQPILQAELRSRARLLSTVESSPLTPEQSRAVLTYDSRVRVIAAAGSGKTAVMVARAAYAIDRGFAAPDRIVMLAFNADAARELDARVRHRLTRAGLDPEGIRVSTFHAFGLDVIERATGTRPPLASWVADGTETEHIAGILADLVADGVPLPEPETVSPDRLPALLHRLMGHVKAGNLTRAELRSRLAGRRDEDATRTRRLLDLYWKVHDRWDQDLAEAGAVDYDAMLSEAARHLERKRTLLPVDLVMVDEFQDTSPARARLVKALADRDGTHLLVVGDDWQAINGFAGADASLLTDFASWCGPALTRRLETTFRTTQTIADVAGRFVARNPAQITKAVHAAAGPGGAPVTVVTVTRRRDLTAALRDRLAGLAEASDGATVDVLGRYRSDEALLPRDTPMGIDVTFRTMHGSKGLEADHVIVPAMTRGRDGFPSSRADDPLLALATASEDDFPDAEERRLLYVALTRARVSVTILTVEGEESPFVEELVADPAVVTEGPLRIGDGERVAGAGR